MRLIKRLAISFCVHRAEVPIVRQSGRDYSRVGVSAAVQNKVCLSPPEVGGH